MLAVALSFRAVVLLVFVTVAVVTSAGAYQVALVQHAMPRNKNVSKWLLQYSIDVASIVGQVGTVDMVVFPEFGLISEKAMSKCGTPSTSELGDECFTLPKINTTMCPRGNLSAAAFGSIEMLACTAAEHQTMIAANLCERDVSGTQWNTEVVFSSLGVLVAKYRKFHPYKVKCFAKPKTLDVISFEGPASTNETFGVFTCLDILYPEPSKTLYDRGIRHFVFSSEIPIVGREVKEVWSQKHPGAFLLASDSANGSTGVFYNGHFTPPWKTLKNIGEENGDVAYVHVVPL
jgi:hypothetical protein